MSMELSNQKKLSEFYEELKRLNINIVRPDINNCSANFTSNGKDFFYALGAIKNVGYEAISNIVNERKKNGKYENLIDFINRVDPKDINKLQLEGLVKAGAFDNLNDNRQSLFNSIPNIITKSKNNFDNKSTNQFDLFSEDEKIEVNFLEKISDWNTDVKLSKEFETLGFFISDHPLNQYKSIFDQYNIVSYDKFQNDESLLSSNVACTILKTQEKKTQKGTSYAIIKFSDLDTVFEIFIFSDLFETNREILVEGNSLMLTLMKNYTDESKIQKKINVKKIITLKEVVDKPINKLKIIINEPSDLKKLSKLNSKDGKTELSFEIVDGKRKLHFNLKERRKIDYKLINALKINENIVLD